MMKSTHPTDTTYVGDDWVLSRILGPPYTPLSGKTFQWAMSNRGTLEQVIPPTDATIIVTDPAEGVLEVHVAAEVTNLLANDRYYDALRMIDTNGSVYTIQTGQVHVLNPAFNATAPMPPDLVGPPGPPGPQGIPGPVGPVGPQGPQGPSAQFMDYSFNEQTTEPPGSGQVRLNNSNQMLATTIYISQVTSPGNDAAIILNSVLAGNQLYLQDKDDSTKWQLYRVAPGAYAVAPAGHYYFPVTWVDGGLPLTAQRIFLSITQ